MPVDKAFPQLDAPSVEDMPEDDELIVELPGQETEEIIEEEARHDDNLANEMEDGELHALANDLIAAYEADLSSREDWERTYRDGIELLGMKIEDRNEPFPGACGVFHPVLAEAVVRFQAQAITETFPASGPAQTKIVGKITKEKEKQAQRVQEDLNYMLTEKMVEYRSEHEKLLFSVALAGSSFKKNYFDERVGRPVSMFLPPEDIVVPYGATDLRTTPRYTHRMRMSENDIRKRQYSEFYRDIDLNQSIDASDEVKEEKDELEGVSPQYDHDDRHTLLEMYVEWDLPGFEHEDEDGPTGIELPYIITIDKDSGAVLSIYRNWNEEDEDFKAEDHISHYQYIPGTGFYGLGLIHLIGGLAKSATSMQRQLIDAGTFANLPGGLKTRGLRIKGEDKPIRPGEWRDVDVIGSKIQDNLHALPYKEPSAVLAALLGETVEEARRFASMADIKASDMNAQAPVGTTLAILERAQKLITGVQARLHAAMKNEFKILTRIITDYMDDKYDYETEEQASRKFDYAAVDILPVSDPSAASMSQRIMQHQAALDLSAQARDIYNIPELHRSMLTTLGLKNVDVLVPDPDDIPALDPVTENMAILKGEPVRAHMHQDHEAHITAHMAAAEDPMMQAIISKSEQAGAVQAAMTAHVTEHVAFAYRKKIEEEMGVELPVEGPLPPEAEQALSNVVAEAAGRVLKKSKQKAQVDEIIEKMRDPVVIAQERELDIKEQDLELRREKEKSRHEEAMARLQQDNAQFQVEMGQRLFDSAMGADESARQLTAKETADDARAGVEIVREAMRIKGQMEVAKEASKNGNTSGSKEGNPQSAE